MQKQKTILRFLISYIFFAFFSNTVWAQDITQEKLLAMVKTADSTKFVGNIEEAIQLYWNVIEASKSIDNYSICCHSYTYLAFIKSGHSKDYEGALALIDQGIALADEHIPSDYPAKINLLFAKGIVYLENGHLKEGKQWIEAGNALVIEQNVEEDNLSGKINYNLGNIALREGRLEEAYAFLQKAEFHYTRWGNVIDAVQSLIGCGYVNVRMGNYEKGIEYYNQALKRLNPVSTEDNPETELIYRNLGGAYLEQKKYEKAFLYFEKSSFIAKSIHGANSLNYARALLNIGACYKETDEFEKALEIFSVVEPIYQANLSPNNRSFGILNFNLGDIYIQLDLLDSAVHHLNKAYDVFKQSFGPESYQCLLTKTNIGKTELKLGRYKEGVGTLDSVFKTSQKVLGKNNDVSLKTIQVLSKTHFKQKEYEKALHTIQKGLITTCKNFNNPDYHSNPSGEDIIYKPDAIWLLRFKAATCYELALERNEPTLFDAVIETATATQHIFDYFRRDLNQGFSMSEETTDNFIDINNILIKAIQKKGETEHDNDRIFVAMENRKSIFLMDAVRRAAADVQLNLPDSIALQQKQLQEQKTILETKIRDLSDNDRLEEAEQLKSDSLFLITLQQEQLIAFIKSNHEAYYDLIYQSTSLNVNSLDQVLKPEESLISYAINHYSKELVIGLYKKEQPVEIIFQPLQDDWVEKLTVLNKLLQSNTLIRPKKKTQFLQLSKELYEQFIAPISQKITESEKLIIVGEDLSHYLPFEVLIQSDKGEAFSDMHFLLKSFEISYHNSVQLFVQARTMAPVENGNFLAFAPVFEDQFENGEISSKTRSMIDTTLTAFRNSSFKTLKYSKEEVEGIQQQFAKQKVQAKTLLHEKATEKILKEELIKPYQYIHIASHSFANIKQPKFSGIACSQPKNKDSNEDGILHVNEIYQLNVGADLLVLSSCESGLGKLVTGEGMLGLNRSFIYAGVPNVIFSLWKVNDKVTSQLMIKFYEYILGGASYAQALRATKLDLLKEKTTASPNHWAAFLLVGK